MTLRIAAITLATALPLFACGDTNARFPIAAPTETSQTRVAVRSIEVREVSLPAYAAASEIVVEQEDGALTVVSKAIWADDPVRGVTGALARSLDLRSTANVAAEPWPLADAADARLEVRIDRMIAKMDGQFELSGQFAIAAPRGAIRETIQRFTVTAPMTDNSPAAVAQATGVAIDNLAAVIIKKLGR
ncbi:membrane integrity-associated transporter subunit PqiC (plasmid) [Pseudorhodobacter turbinis]|uniref:Membrane integrity-associated transporter subunit PqiC n=1 Tax=Pseudorhodobacter turbinis TaxID=2500533 RepID=A0A4P8EJQ3_9RHOB|nr:PqiC family protein [Pseudorhodobacter turbinis]QCO57209.1 membrane integrity-associated transporter subunit PqiC [Pseudorhodobacter turbinis]